LNIESIRTWNAQDEGQEVDLPTNGGVSVYLTEDGNEAGTVRIHLVDGVLFVEISRDDINVEVPVVVELDTWDGDDYTHEDVLDTRILER